jgi:glycosyltransferase involved in cell wall biosynthesis
VSAAPPAFSVLLPVYRNDRPEFVRDAFLSSTSGQILKPSEIVLVQDGPVPPDLEATLSDLVADSAVPAKRVRLERNRGLAAALNAGLAAASHDVVARMDADDLSEPERFARQLPLLSRGYDVVGSGISEFVEDDQGTRSIVSVRTPPVTEADIARYSRFHVPLYHPTVVFRRSAVQAAGGYEPCGYMEDYWLWARMLASGARATNVPGPLLRYRVSSGAYARRGGLALLRSELDLQRRFRSIGFTSRGQYARNVLIRGVYRVVPERLRRPAYRRLIAADGLRLHRGTAVREDDVAVQDVVPDERDTHAE